MKTSLQYGILLLGVASLLSCKKADDATPSENTLSAFLGTESTVTSGVRTSGPWELGVVFSASAAGKITQVGSKMPEPGTYRVCVWDFDTKQVLRQKSIEQTAPDKLVLNDVEALPLTPNKKYVVSINSQSGGTNKKYSYAYKTGGGEFMPFTKGSILIYNACYKSIATASFPDGITNVKYELYGYPEFTFIPD